MARKNVKYRKYHRQTGNPMWVDPASIGKSGCALFLLVVLAAPVVAAVSILA